MSICSKTFLSIIILMLLCVDQGLGQVTRLRLVKSYTNKEFPNSRQNWAFEQEDDGKIIIGNSGAVNVFNGVNWSYTHVAIGNTVYSLAKSDSGIIYTGGEHDIGYISSDTLGRLSFKSLLDRIDKSFDEVRQVFHLDGKVYFRSEKKIFIYDEKKTSMQVLIHENDFDNSFKVNNRIYVQVKGEGIMDITNGTLEMTRHTEMYAADSIFGMIEYNASDILIYSRGKGLHVFDGLNYYSLGSEINNYLKEHDGYRMIWIDKDRIAIATLSGGLSVIDKKGNILEIITENEGLNDNAVHGLFVDRQGLLWVALDDGISVFDTNPNFYSQYKGIDGFVTKVIERQQYIFVFTNKGIFVKQKNTSSDFKRIEGSSHHFNSTLELEEYIIAASSKGLYEVTENMLKKISDHVYSSVLKIDQNSFVAINKKKVDIIVYDAKEYSAKTILQNKILTGLGRYYNRELFLEDNTGKIIVFNLITEEEHTVFLPKEIKSIEHINMIRDGLYLGSNSGLWIYDKFTTSFIRSNTFAHEAIRNKQVDVFQECRNEIWFRANRSNYRFSDNGSLFTIDKSLFNVIAPLEGIYSISCGNDKVYLGGDNKFFEINYGQKGDNEGFNTNITGVYMKNDSLIYGGFRKLKEPIDCSYEDNELRFTYAAASYIAPERNTYQYKLEGYDKEWSDWSLETQKDYTNLREGNYTFLVRSRNVYEVDGSMDSISFTIQPPWYRTWLAYITYAILITLFLYLIYKIRLNQILKVHKIRNRIAGDLHDDISGTLVGISNFAGAVQTAKDENSRMHYIDLIKESADETKEKITDIVWSINPEHDEWVSFLAKCRRYASDLFEAAGIEYELDMLQDISRNLKMEKRQNVWMIFKELVTNIVRHSNATEAKIMLQREDKYLLLRVIDNGIGFDTDNGSRGNGINNVFKRAEWIKAKVTVDSNEESGTVWEIHIPV